MATKEEFKQKCINVVSEYLQKENVYDFMKFASMRDTKGLKQLKDWVLFVRENFTKEEYESFVYRVLPFERLDKDANEKYKEKVAEVVYKVFEKKAGLIDVIDELGVTMDEFLYLARQLRFTYKLISQSQYQEICKFHERVENYNRIDEVHMTVSSMNKQQRERLQQVLRERKLKVNDITYYEAYKYLIRKGEIVLANSQR